MQKNSNLKKPRFSSIWPIDRTLIKCYHSEPEWTWEQWQWRHTPHSPKPQHHWNLTIRLFSVISRTLVAGVGSYPSAEKLSVYSTALANWATIYTNKGFDLKFSGYWFFKNGDNRAGFDFEEHQKIQCLVEMWLITTKIRTLSWIHQCIIRKFEIKQSFFIFLFSLKSVKNVDIHTFCKLWLI